MTLPAKNEHHSSVSSKVQIDEGNFASVNGNHARLMQFSGGQLSDSNIKQKNNHQETEQEVLLQWTA